MNNNTILVVAALGLGAMYMINKDKGQQAASQQQQQALMAQQLAYQQQQALLAQQKAAAANNALVQNNGGSKITDIFNTVQQGLDLYGNIRNVFV
ncbi:hypothetical protein [uncultured Pontibacter sp.]|uniref:hypothetical protein n=1 Tax=uncultured Pontibacter sp. TaxID=453356 RepID=UPI0026323878|nr:hypothetical protein [uncultured Pontibacter sp.]